MSIGYNLCRDFDFDFDDLEVKIYSVFMGIFS